MKVFYPTDPLAKDSRFPTVFLAGSIEMGKAENWQNRVIEEMKDDDVVFFNPRRTDWDSSWKQTKDDPQFSHQVKWELDHLEKADIIALYLAPGTVSPISLLELGMYLGSDKVIICCPEGFPRKGNIDITVEEYYGIKVHENFEEFVETIKNTVVEMNGY